jgi:replication factor C large subunit
MERKKPWIIKNRPKTTKDIIGNRKAVTELSSYIRNFRQQKKKAALIYGGPGVGKTSSVYAIADELNHEVIEPNASDFRNKDKINSIVGAASKQMSLFAKGKIILVDEVDGLSGTKDWGAASAVISIIKETSFPVILTAGNPYEDKLSKLRTKCSMIHFESLDYNDIFSNLAFICKKEGIDFNEPALKSLSRRVGGDMRAAINDLQILSMLGKRIEKEDVEKLYDREKKETIINAMVKIFKVSDPKIAVHAFDYVDEDIDKTLLWIDENLPKEYKDPESLNRAYDALSRADVYKGRIRRWQHWRFLVYINALITAGVSTAKDERNKEFVQYKPTMRLLKIWQANMKYMKRKSIAKKIAEATHTSSYRVMQSTLPYIHTIFLKNKLMAKEIEAALDLDSDETKYLLK